MWTDNALTIKYSKLQPKDTVYFRIANHKYANRAHWYFKDLIVSGDYYHGQIFGALVGGLFYYVDETNG